MANLSKTTSDHEEIRKWAEERGGKPSHVKSTGSAKDIGILRIDFPGFSGGGSLEPISWEEWFEKFDERNLALLYQEETAAGERSNFNKIVSAETAKENEERAERSRGGRSSSRSRGGQRGGSASAKKTDRKETRGRAGGQTSSKKTAQKKTVAKKSAGGAKKSAATGSRGRGGSKTSGTRRGQAKTSGRAGQAKKSSTKKSSSKRR